VDRHYAKDYAKHIAVTMIRATASVSGPAFEFKASVGGLAIYLDNWAIGELAEGDSSRRARFIRALRVGADLLFSVTNAAELPGPLGRSAEMVRAFLDEVGEHWFPVELNVLEVVNREKSGKDVSECCTAEEFMRAYFRNRTAGYMRDSGKIISLSSDFFSLGKVCDWLAPERDDMRKLSEEYDGIFGEEILRRHREYEADPSTLAKFPALSYDPALRATFVTSNLVRTLIIEAETHPPKKGDGCDFSHAVMASAFASFATLDRHWKRRIDNLPKPNQLARIYYGPELDQMVADIETQLETMRARGVLAVSNA
jgi:hypothetical protein